MHHRRPEALCWIHVWVIVIHLKVPVFLPLCFRLWVLQLIKHPLHPIQVSRISVTGDCSVLQHPLTWNIALKAALSDSSVNQDVTAAVHSLLFFSVLLTYLLHNLTQIPNYKWTISVESWPNKPNRYQNAQWYMSTSATGWKAENSLIHCLTLL